jgi:protein phosphatase
MGTTFCALTFHNDRVAVSHVGDSRIYLSRDGALEQLTQDHCWTRGLFPYVAEEDHPSKGVLTRAIGTLPEVEPAIRLMTPQPQDLFLICTDGLSDMLTHDEIESALNRPLTIGEKARLLVSSAKQKGGGDNITVILVEVSHGDL